MDKKEIRTMLAARKAAMTPAERAEEEARLWARVEALDAFQAASTVLLYCSLPDEVSTSGFMERWARRKRLILPLVCGDDLLLKEYDPSRVHPGYRGIIEPDGDLPSLAPQSVDFALVPGVAFTPDGYRLGRGKGFYDRLLPQLRCPTAGVCYSCQILDDLPLDPWDRPVTHVVEG